jgi:ribonuclease R
MRLAIYSPDNIGHFGLGLSHYTHFTSPIRRYIDLVVHRILFNDVKSHEELDLIAADCSEKERVSARAEQNVRQLKKLRLLEDIHQKEPKKQYEAIVTKVRNFGVVFEVLELMLEGYFHLSELDGDYYIYDDRSVSLDGRHTGKSFKAGDKILVMVNTIDLISLESTWHLVPDLSNESSPRKQMTIKRDFDNKRSNRKDSFKKGSDKKNPYKKGSDKKETDKSAKEARSKADIKTSNRSIIEESLKKSTGRAVPSTTKPVPNSRAKDFFTPKLKPSKSSNLKKKGSPKPDIAVSKKVIKTKARKKK